jgi:protein-S-isoprenylcysteine O-methyltransferase Ste14
MLRHPEISESRIHGFMVELRTRQQSGMLCKGSRSGEHGMKGSKTSPNSVDRGSVMQWAIKQMVYAIALAAVLFLASGHFAWVEAWVFLGLVLLIGIFSSVVLVRRSPDLLAERSRMQEGMKAWDKGLSLFMAFSPLLMAATAGLEKRFGAVCTVSLATLITCVSVGIGGSLFTLWAMATNRFFSGVVRIQNERGHTTVSTGPYRYVRHPGYLGAIAFTVATPVILGSSWTFIPAGLTVAATVLRTKLEDDTLRQELGGYSSYAARVRFRLFPGFW